jgi:hypothetical protein
MSPGVDATSTAELWEGNHQVATIRATRYGIHIECAPGYEPAADALSIEVQQPVGIRVALRRS